MQPELRTLDHGSGSTDPTVRARFIRQLLDELVERDGDVAGHRYSALAGALEDAKQEHDELSLLAAQRGLQRLYSRQLSKVGARAEHYEQRGRTLQALDGVTWTLERLTPAAVAASLESGSHAQHFLEAVERNPGIYSG